MAPNRINGKRKSQYFINRELSWLEFNRRVLEEGMNSCTPLLERLKYLAIVSSNFDEFFMVRFAGRKRQLQTGNHITCPSGLSPGQQLERISATVREIVDRQSSYFLNTMLPALAKEGIRIVEPADYTAEQHSFTQHLFEEEIFHVLTPLALDPEKGFPFKGNLQLYLAFLLRRAETEQEKFAVVQLPKNIGRLHRIPATKSVTAYTLLEEIIVEHADLLFPGYSICEQAVFRVTRDAALSVDENRDEDFLGAIQELVNNREQSAPVRLEISNGRHKLHGKLRKMLNLNQAEVYEPVGPLDLSEFMKLTSLPINGSLAAAEWKPQAPQDISTGADFWQILRRQDVLLFHPYESFEPVVKLLQEAAIDSGVISIKMTLYRTNDDSQVIKALIDAAQRGKQVTVVVELKARFDEEKNIGWAQELESSGVVVLFGIAGLKVHCKALMIIRREQTGITRYVHLSTGNYNEKTARLYTDIGYLTSREDLSHDLALLFNSLTGYSVVPSFNKLIAAPLNLRQQILALIEREIRLNNSSDGGLIMCKMNALVDPEVIEAFYRASQNGVKIRLNIRGMCCLRPGLKRISENVQVVSIVDRFLEHSRIFYFQNGGQEEVYLSSADMMPRNLDRRVELMFPIEAEEHKARLIALLQACFKDNQNAHQLNPDGTSARKRPGSSEEHFRSQEHCHRQAMLASQNAKNGGGKVFQTKRDPLRSV